MIPFLNERNHMALFKDLAIKLFREVELFISIRKPRRLFFDQMGKQIPRETIDAFNDYLKKVKKPRAWASDIKVFRFHLLCDIQIIIITIVVYLIQHVLYFR